MIMRLYDDDGDVKPGILIGHIYYLHDDDDDYYDDDVEPGNLIGHIYDDDYDDNDDDFDYDGDGEPGNLIGHINHLLLRGVQPQHQQSLNIIVTLMMIKWCWYNDDDHQKPRHL